MSGRAKILFEADLRGPRKVQGKLSYVLDVRTAPTVDGLVIIADSEYFAVPRAQKPEPTILRLVHILILVRKHRVKTPGPAIEVANVFAHRPDGPEQKIPEIGGIGVAQDALIRDIDPGSRAPVAGIDRQASNEAIRARWMTLMRENHPDSLASRGVPPAMIAAASDRVARINAAYDSIKRERRL